MKAGARRAQLDLPLCRRFDSYKEWKVGEKISNDSSKKSHQAS